MSLCSYNILIYRYPGFSPELDILKGRLLALLTECGEGVLCQGERAAIGQCRA